MSGRLRQATRAVPDTIARELRMVVRVDAHAHYPL